VPSPDPFGEARAAEAVKNASKLFEHTCASCHEHRELKTTEFCLDRDCKRPVLELPPDLRCDTLRTVYPGSELNDLYRIIAAGIGGAGMPPWKGSLPEEDLWSLAYYVRSLRGNPTGCNLSRTGQ
jgi:mono/diheme cytochrome c family protein